MIARWQAWRKRRAKRLGEARARAELAELWAQELAIATAPIVDYERVPPPAAVRDEPDPPQPPSAYVRHLWPPFPPPLPSREHWTRQPAPPADLAWRAATIDRPGRAVYPPRPDRPRLDDGPGHVP